MSGDVYESKRRPIIDGYLYAPRLSTSTIAVYYKNQTGEYIVAIRGTWKIADVYWDYKLAVGKLMATGRFQEAQRVIANIKLINPRARVTLTGHSLGGNICILLALQNPEYRCVVFNPSQGFPERIDASLGKNITIYVVRGDPIGFLSRVLPYNIVLLNKVSNNPITNHQIGAVISQL